MGVLDAPFIAKETFGTKLRRLALHARNNDPFNRTSIVAAPAWVLSTAYTVGRVVKNGTGYYICIVAGTSAASGGPTGTTGRSVVDGTVNWVYYGPATVGPTDPTAPAYSSGTTAPSGLTNLYYPASTRMPGAFRIYGAASEDAGNSVFVRRFFTKSGTKALGDCRVACWTDSPRFAIIAASGAIMRVRIDGRFYSPDTIDYQASTSYHTFDFTASGGRRPRLIEMDIHRTLQSFSGIAVASTDQVWAPDIDDDVSAVFISDSIFAGSAYGPSAHSVPQMISAKLGWSSCWNFSTGGTGYIEPNTAGGGPFYTFGQRIAEAATVVNPDVWLFAGSLNDRSYTAAAVQAAALAALQAVRAVSRAPIVVVGVWPVDMTGTISLLAAEQAVAAAVTQFADPLGKTYFIPLYGDPVLPWVTHTNNNTAFATSNNSTQVVANDNTHPADTGSRYLADRLSNAIRSKVLPYLP